MRSFFTTLIVSSAIAEVACASGSCMDEERSAMLQMKSRASMAPITQSLDHDLFDSLAADPRGTAQHFVNVSLHEQVALLQRAQKPQGAHVQALRELPGELQAHVLVSAARAQQHGELLETQLSSVRLAEAMARTAWDPAKFDEVMRDKHGDTTQPTTTETTTQTPALLSESTIEAQLVHLLRTALLQTGIKSEQPELAELVELLVQQPEAVAEVLDNADDAVKEALVKRANQRPHRERLLRAFLALPDADRAKLVMSIQDSPHVNRVYRALTKEAQSQLLQLARQGDLEGATGAKDEPGDREWWNLVGKITDMAGNVLDKAGDIIGDATGGSDGASPGDGSEVAEEHFTQAQVSPFSGVSHQFMSALELEVIDLINAKRKEGFTCGDPAKGEEEVVMAPTSATLEVDCRLWWAAKLHDEDMAIRQFYSHVTTFPNGTQMDLVARTRNNAWMMEPHVEILIGVQKPQDSETTPNTAASVVDGWLNSRAHCMGMGHQWNALVGVATVACPSEGITPESCQFGHYWSGLFTWTKASVGAAMAPSVPDQGIDRSCYPPPGF